VNRSQQAPSSCHPKKIPKLIFPWGWFKLINVPVEAGCPMDDTSNTKKKEIGRTETPYLSVIVPYGDDQFTISRRTYAIIDF
jgi:hypothetical protein